MSTETVKVIRVHREKVDPATRRVWRPGTYEVDTVIADMLEAAGAIEPRVKPAAAKQVTPAAGRPPASPTPEASSRPPSNEGETPRIG